MTCNGQGDGIRVCTLRTGCRIARRSGRVLAGVGLVGMTACGPGPNVAGDAVAGDPAGAEPEVEVIAGHRGDGGDGPVATGGPSEWTPGAWPPRPWWMLTGADVEPDTGADLDTGAAVDEVDGGEAEEGIPFGFWGLDGYLDEAGLQDVQRRFGATVVQGLTADPEWAVDTLLPMARAAGMRVTLRMTGGPSHYTTGGRFDIDKWKAMVDPWVGSGVQEYIDDGTLVGHMLLDDIDNFEVRDPTAAELDEMARYSKARLPGLMTFVRKQASELPVPPDGRYHHLDAAVNQYSASEGDVTTYAVAERDAAVSLGLGVINGLNLANGGDGSSGQPGWGGEGTYAMSAAEIMTAGAVLVSVPECGMFLSWEFDGEERWPDGTVGADYLASGEVQAALAAVGRLAAAHERVELLQP